MHEKDIPEPEAVMIASPYLTIFAALLAAAPTQALVAQQTGTAGGDLIAAVGPAAAADRKRALGEIRVDVQRQLRAQQALLPSERLRAQLAEAELVQVTERPQHAQR
jgi:hypothetical protein